MKKYILLVLCFVTQQLSALEGFYCGGSLGGGFTEGPVRQNLEFIDATMNVDQFYNFQSHFLEGSVDASLFAGYSLHLNRFCIGVEGFARYSSDEFSISRSNQTADSDCGFLYQQEDKTKFRVGPWHYGVDVCPGFLVGSCACLYGRVGVEWSTLKIQEFAQSTVYADDVLEFILPVSNAHTKKRAHLRLGVGFEKCLGSHLALTTDYIFTDYGRCAVDILVHGVNTGGGSTQANDSVNGHLRNHALLVGLSYYFCPIVNACPNVCCGCPCFRGFYAAGAVGGTLLNGQVEGTAQSFFIDASGDTGSIVQTLSPKLSQTSVDGTFYFGYGIAHRFLYGGVEGIVNYAHLSSREIDSSYSNGSGDVFNIQAKTCIELLPWHIGIAFRPGLLLNAQTLLYGSIGTSLGVLKGKSAVSTFGMSGLEGSGQLEFSSKSTRASLRAGGGLEYALNSRWHLRIDYVFEDFGKLEMKKSISTTAPNTTTTTVAVDANVRFSTHTATLGVARYF